MSNREGSLLRDSKIMFIRSLKLSFRSPGAVGVAFMAPASMLIIFVYVFGGAMDFGDFSVVNFIVPGIILLSIGQNAPAVSVRLSNDMAKGVIDRFRSMPIAKSSILIGYVSATVLQNIATVALSICAALVVGFRPQANLIEWLMAMGIIVLYIIMITWLAVLFGVYAKDAEGASGFMTLVSVLPFLSSGFVLTETMPTSIRIFAENQPMTPIMNSVRALLLSEPLLDGTLHTALLWCVGLAIAFCMLAVRIYKRKTTK